MIIAFETICIAFIIRVIFHYTFYNNDTRLFIGKLILITTGQSLGLISLFILLKRVSFSRIVYYEITLPHVFLIIGGLLLCLSVMKTEEE